MSDHFKASLRRLPAAKPRHQPSAARARIRETFDDITAARARGVSWKQIADLMTSDGIRATDGEPMTAAKVNSLYAAEKATKGQRRKRRTRKSTQEPAANSAAPADTKIGQARLNALAPRTQEARPTPYGRKPKGKSIWDE